MDKETDKKLETFTKKMFSDLPPEVPSFDFTTRVMAQIETVPVRPLVGDRPLISKEVWLLVAVATIGVFSILIFGDFGNDITWSPYMQSAISTIKEITLPDLKISKVFLYGVVTFTFFMALQIVVLKHHFNKRFA
ncbi:MAG: hypothetical protein WBM83_03160 [Flavobacteriaceae bacterium]